MAAMRIRLKVKEVTEKRGLTRAALARRADLTYETIFKIWRNPYQEVSLLTVVKLAGALNVAVTDLFEVTDSD